MALELDPETIKYLERLVKRGGHEGEKARSVLEIAKYDEDQPRDDHGRFAGGSGRGESKEPSTHGRFGGNLDVKASQEHIALIDKLAERQSKKGEKPDKDEWLRNQETAQGRAKGLQLAAEMYRNGATHAEVLAHADKQYKDGGYTFDGFSSKEGMYAAVRGKMTENPTGYSPQSSTSSYAKPLPYGQSK